MDFDLDKATPRLPSMVAFQIPVSVQNIIIHQCVIDEGASTCIMSKNVWQNLGAPELKPSIITLRAYDSHPLTPIGLFKNVPIFFSSKTVHIDIEVLDAHLEYNIILGKSYMYAMSAITSSIFCIMMFPHEDWIIIVDQLTHTEKRPLNSTDMVLPYVDTTTDGLLRYQ